MEIETPELTPQEEATVDKIINKLLAVKKYIYIYKL